MNAWGWILRRMGWTYRQNIALPDKCVIAIAPHTSNVDFLMGEIATRSVGIKASFLMKKTWFFFPLGYLMRALGGIPVDRSSHAGVTQSVVHAFETHARLAVGVTPEGTRRANAHWHKGCLYMAKGAGVPLLLAYIDYGTRTVCIDREFDISDDPDADIARMKAYFRPITPRHPSQFLP